MKLKQIRVDGYKNLIGCVVNLGDFNVIVGPNNSGKSNLLEVLHVLGSISFGSQEKRNRVLSGDALRSNMGFSSCHLKEHQHKPIRIGLTLESAVSEVPWIADYEIMIRCSRSEEEKGTIVSEMLSGKRNGRAGRATKYISREEDGFSILMRGRRRKKHRIARDNSCLSALPSLYPDGEDLPPELLAFYRAIKQLTSTLIMAPSPSKLREVMDTERPMRGSWVSGFDIGLVVDAIKEEGTYYDLFRESLCDMMNLEDVRLNVDVKRVPSKNGEGHDAEKRIRYIFIERRGDRASLIEEYSDGTLVIAAILAALCYKERRGPILCLEELETCLHPSALGKLIGFLRNHSQTWPVLITTHSPYLLNLVDPEDVNVAIIDESGATNFEKIQNTRQLRDYLKSGFMSFGDMLASNFDDVIRK